MGIRDRGLVASFGLAAALVAVGGRAGSGPAPGPEERWIGDAIPTFSRLYRTSCSTCHLAPPKLNVLGEAFRLNGYRFPKNDALLREVEAVPLGAEAWKQAWPRAIWPGELPAVPPLAIRLINDAQWTADETESFDWTYRFPAEVSLLSAVALDDRISAFAEVEWSPEDEVEVGQARIRFEVPLRFLPERSLYLGVGKQNLRLLSFADPQLDRIARERLLWQDIDPEELRLVAVDGSSPAPEDVAPPLVQPAISVEGIVSRRWSYGVGLAQGAANLGIDENDAKDLYWRVALKLGGLAFDGTYDEVESVPPVGPGQLFDRGVVLEHFGYRGRAPGPEGADDEHWTWGAAARWMSGPLEVGAGYVRGQRDDPWGIDPPVGLEWESAFGRLEWFAWPWLAASLKAETFRASLDRPNGAALASADRTRVLPGLVALIRPNIRAVAEGSLWLEHDSAEAAGLALPHDLWFRLDVAF